MPEEVQIAYFSMEIGLESSIPTYAGGLGVLAGDSLRAAADAGLPMVAVTLLSRKGYFLQRLDDQGVQREEPVHWAVNDYLLPVNVKVNVELEDRLVAVCAWRYDVKGVCGQVVPVFLLDTDVQDNTAYDRRLTDELYGGDQTYRLSQEVILGIGGVRVLRALGYSGIRRFHMNEGHSSLLVYELLREFRQQGNNNAAKHIDQVRQACVFTSHTPVAAGHDRFPMALAEQVLQQHTAFTECARELCWKQELNLTYLALAASHYVNGVAKKHRETSSKMFEGYLIDSITNGVHAATWACRAISELFDQHIPDWREDNAGLRYALSIPREDIWRAHQLAKRALLETVNKTANAGMDQNVFTLGFARRATFYKRPTLLFTDVQRLRAMVNHCGPLQLIFAGKAHPKDKQGKDLIREIFRFKQQLGDGVRIAYLPDYDMNTGKLMTAGVDLWLNTPQPPLEASGTSGMKAAINGVPSLSIPDGWWLEGCIEGVTGWVISNGVDSAVDMAAMSRAEADVLYSKLENMILPMYYRNRDNYIDVMRHAIAINGSFFNTQRMMSQYLAKAYFK